MATYTKLSDLLNTTSGMTVLRSNSAQDDGVDTVDGVDWFTFNGTVATKLYVSGNSFVGFGTSAEHLKVCRRDCKMWYLYRQEGIIGRVKFLKIRWEGYAKYSALDSSYALVWELFIFDDGGMFLNVVSVPSVSGHIGTNALTCGNTTYPYTIELSTPVSYSFLYQDDGSFVVTTDDYPIIVNHVPSGECEFSTKVVQRVTAVKYSYISWTESIPEGTSLKVFSALSEEDYVECENGRQIPCIFAGDDLTGKTLRVKVLMTTDDTTLSPTLRDLVIQIFDAYDDNMLVLVFDPGTPNSIQRAAGDITVTYDGSGTLVGEGGPVAAFEHTFTPVDLDPKNNPLFDEHIEIANIVSTGILTRIYYTNISENEHIDLADISAVGVLTRIDDI